MRLTPVPASSTKRLKRRGRPGGRGRRAGVHAALGARLVRRIRDEAIESLDEHGQV